MKIIYLGELVDVIPKKQWVYKGVELVLHRPFNSELSWNVSEFNTGKQVGKSGKTMGEAIDGAQRTVDFAENNLGGNHVMLLYVKATKTVNKQEAQKVGDMVQPRLF